MYNPVLLKASYGLDAKFTAAYLCSGLAEKFSMFMKSFDFVGFIACMGKRSTGSPFFLLANHLISKV